MHGLMDAWIEGGGEGREVREGRGGREGEGWMVVLEVCRVLFCYRSILHKVMEKC